MYNFSLTTSTVPAHKTNQPIWFRINGNGTNADSNDHSEWFNVSSFPEYDTNYMWQQELNFVGMPIEITVLSYRNDRFGFTFIGVNNQAFDANGEIVVLDAFTGTFVSAYFSAHHTAHHVTILKSEMGDYSMCL